MTAPGDPSDPSARIDDCLERLDGELLRLLDDGDLSAELLDEGTAELHELVEAVLQREAAPSRVELHGAVDGAVRSFVAALPFPVVVSTQLAAAGVVLAHGAELVHAVHRALALGAGHVGPGGELVVRTTGDAASAVFELRGRRGPAATDPSATGERALTLRAFVAAMRGRCRCTVLGDGELELAIELPLAAVADRDRPGGTGW